MLRRFNCVVAPVDCDTDSIDCVAILVDCDTDSFHCVAIPVDCDTGSFHCVAIPVDCDTSSFHCVANPFDCIVNSINCLRLPPGPRRESGICQRLSAVAERGWVSRASIRSGKPLTKRAHPDPLGLKQTTFVSAYRRGSPLKLRGLGEFF